MSTTVTYNGYSLQTDKIINTELDFQSVEIENSDARRSTTDRFKFVESYIGRTDIIWEGYIKGTGQADAEMLLDEIKENVITEQPGFLDIAYAGSTRRYRVKAGAVPVTKESASLDVKYISIRFQKYDLLGLETTATVLEYPGETASIIEKEVTFGGTYEVEPVYILNFVASTGVTNIKLFVEETNREMEIQQVITAGDELIVDIPNKIVKYNNSSIDTLGIFPTVKKGTNNISFEITSTSHEVDITISYVKRYL